MPTSKGPRSRWRFQFSLQRLLVVVVLLALMIGSLSGLLRPGPPWRMVDGAADDLARGLGITSLAEPTAVPMQVVRDPAETKIYLMLAVLGPLGLVVVLALIWRARHIWRWFWGQWGW